MELFGKALGHHALIGAMRAGGRHHPTSPEDLATKWGIGVDATQWTLEILADDKGDVLKTKKDKLKARIANKKGTGTLLCPLREYH